MDKGFQKLGFASTYRPNAFKIVGNSMQTSEAVAEYNADTSLCLYSSSSSLSCAHPSKGTKRKWSSVDGSMDLHGGSSLSLGLGRSPSSSDSKGSSATGYTTMSSAKEFDEESSMDLELDFFLHLGNDKMSSLMKPAKSNAKGLDVQPRVDLELSLSTGTSESDITSIHPTSNLYDFGMEIPVSVRGGHNVDERSTSDWWQKNSVLRQQAAQRKEASLCNQIPRMKEPFFGVPDLSSSVVTTPKSSVTCTSGISQRQHHHCSSGSKTCQVEGCGKGARGASGRCISHGGGRRCQRQGCHKGAEGRTVYCKAHGGGRRCEFLGCTKSSEGRTDFCIAHGGGRRCSHDGCTRAARGKSGLCIRHGGGKRCQMENCTKSAEGISGLCISHGGGRRCQAQGCSKGAQGSTMYCKAHGGGKRCTFPACNKGAEESTPFCKGHGRGKRCAFQGEGVCTKSVHGVTNFCVAHGGGKRCAVPECTKSARGRTDFCVRHGGGKRCRFEDCSKSAQGSTDFCKAHGGGKRCSWGHHGEEHGRQSTSPCNAFTRGKTGLCALHSDLVQDKMMHGGNRCRFDGCNKSAQGSTYFCGVHNRDKRCTLPGCAEVGHGGTNFCVAHGDGKRRKFESCGENSQGSTGFSTTIGGENRCSGGHPGYGLQPTDPCKSYSMGRAGLCVLHTNLVQGEIVHCSVSKLHMQHLQKLLEPPHCIYPSISLAVNLRAECIKELYLCCTTTAHLQGLVSLQKIDLSNSNFTRMPDLSSSRKLQTLDLRGCKNLVDISTVQYLTELKYLNLKGCTSLTSLPSLMALKLLSSIDVSDCKHLRRLPPSLGFLSCLTTLNLRNCKRIQALPKSILRLKSLEVLSIPGCSMLMERVSRVAISSAIDTGLVYPPCSTSGSDKMIFEHQERGQLSSLHTLVEELSSSNRPVRNYVSEASAQQFEEATPRHECDSKGKMPFERRTSYEMGGSMGSEDAFNPSSMNQDLKWTSDSLTGHRDALNGYLNMPVEAIHQANAFEKVGETTEILILQCCNPEEGESLHRLLYCLNKLQESVPETMALTNDALISRASLQAKLAGLGPSLVQAEEEYNLLADEFLRMSEEEAELDSEIQRLLAKRDELLHDDNNTMIMH